jgi:hypothetical protein
LQIVKIIVPSRDEFDLMLKDDQFDETKGFLSMFRVQGHLSKPNLLRTRLCVKNRQVISYTGHINKDFLNSSVYTGFHFNL